MIHELHPLCAMWPEMDQKTLNELADDIKANGLRSPITMYEGKVLDGRNRMIACDWAWVKPTFEDYEGDDPASYVVSKNLMRRHLKDSQRAMIAAKMANMRQGQRTDLQLSANSRKVSQTKAAELLNVGHRIVSDANTVLQSGDTELIEAVEKGKIRADPAARKVRARRAKPPSPKKDQPNKIWQDRLTRTFREPLTREQVDPEFKGTDTEWLDKYGHIQVMTAEQYATERFGAWATNVRAVMTEAKKLPDWPKVDHSWLRNPRPRDITRLAEALEYLRPKIAEAEALLARAQSLHQPVGELLPID